MSATDGAGAGTGRAVPGAAVARPSRAAPDRELVLKRNNVERLKAEKFPLEIFEEIPNARRPELPRPLRRGHGPLPVVRALP